MNNDLKVSIIIPVYNVKKYINKCMDSLVAQSLKEIEIIAVDDGSTDGTATILDEYANKYSSIVKVFHKENGGQASARNFALKYAKGKYLGFVDSDDWVDEDMYEKMFDLAEAEHSDIVICDMIDHYPDKDIYHKSSTFDSVFKTTPSACNKLFRSGMIGEDRFPEGLWYEDFEFTTKQLMKTQKISTIHSGFYHCFCRDVSTMNNNNSEKNLDILKVLDHLKSFVVENNFQNQYNDVIEYLILEHILITSINRVARQKNEKKKTVIKQMRKYCLSSYPDFRKDRVYKEMERNRRIIASLNGFGLENISKLLLELKEKL